MNTLIFTLFSLLAAAPGPGCLPAAECARPELVAEVYAGTRREAQVSWWGFDPADSTRFLQSAINSGVPVLHIDLQGSEWVTTPLLCVSNQEIILDAGVVALAKKGEFRGSADPMFRLLLVENVTIRGEKQDAGKSAVIRMRKADYHTEEYVQAEWRHGVSILSSRNVLIQDVTIEFTGGDGIYLGVGQKGVPCENCTIRRVDCNENNRQGISVISARNLLIEDTVMRNTNGTAPQAGIDFEPNGASEELVNCVMRRCVCENNAGDGYEFYLPNLDVTSPKTTVMLEDCVSRGNRRNGLAFYVGRNARSTREPCPCRLVVKNFLTENEGGVGILLRSNQAPISELVFDGVTVRNVAADKPETSPILIQSGIHDTAEVGGVVFRNTTVVDTCDRLPIAFRDSSVNGYGLVDVAGTITLEREGVRTVTELGDTWISGMGYEPKDLLRVPMVTLDLAQVTTSAAEAWGEVRDVPPLRARNNADFLFYVHPGVSELEFTLRSHRVGRNEEAAREVKIVSPDGKTRTLEPLPLAAQVDYRVGTDGVAGWYVVQIRDSRNSFAVVRSNAPVSVHAALLNLISTVGEFAVRVPEGAPQCAFRVFGSDGECVRFTVTDPSGERRFEEGAVDAATFFYPTEADCAAGGLWRLRFDRPTVGVLEDVILTLQGIQPVLIIAE